MGKNNKTFFDTIIKSNTNLIRTILLVFSFFLFTYLLTLLIFNKITNPDSNVKMQFTKEGATIVVASKNKTNAQFLLPASNTWTNTGITIPKNSSIKFNLSGSVNLAAHEMLKSAKEDTELLFKWMNPKGVPFLFRENSDKDKLRKPFLIRPDANIGSVIGYLQKPGSIEPSINNQSPKGTFIIGEVPIPNNYGNDVKLWVIVNDMLLDPNQKEESKIAYMGSKDNWDKDKLKKWESIDSASYWNIWFDDNIGHYLVQMEIEQ